MNIRFDTPEALLLLAFVPLVWRYAGSPVPAWRGLGRSDKAEPITGETERHGIAFAPGFPLNSIPLSSSQTAGAFIANLLRAAAFSLLILALARPQTSSRFIETEASGRDLLLSLDLSGSMEAMDFFIEKRRVTRLEALKLVVRRFIEGRKGDRMGLVIFGEEVFTQCPLTLDHAALQRYVDSMEVSMAGSATAIGDAIAISLKRIKDIEAKSKVIVLVTDGKDNYSRISPIEAAEAAKALGVKIHVIGIGGPGMAPFPVRGVFGTTLVERTVDYDEKALTRIAALTGGEYFNARDTEGLIRISQDIDKLEKRTEKVQEYIEHDERFLAALIPAVLLLLIERALAATVLLRVP